MRAPAGLPWAPALLIVTVAVVLGGCHQRQGGRADCQIVPPARDTKVNVISYPSTGMPFYGEQMAECSVPGRLEVRHQTLPYEELVSQATISLSSKDASRYQLLHVSDNLLVEWAYKGWLAPLDDLVRKYRARYRLDEIPEHVWNAVTVNGHVFAVPGLQNTENLIYRKSVLARYGLDPPRTFDDLERVCQVLKDKGAVRYPLVMMYSKSSDHFPLEFHDLDHSMGGRWFNDDGSPAFNDHTGRAALARMVGLYRECMHPDTVNFTVEDAAIGLQQGQFVMGVLWMNNEPQLDDPKVSRYAGDFGFAPAPAACPTCAPAGAWAIDSWVIPANAGVDRDLLFRLVMEALNTRHQIEASKITLVTRTSAAHAMQSPYWAAGVLAIEHGAEALPPRPYTYLAVNALQQYGMEALLGHLSVEEALDRAAAQFSRAMHDEGYGVHP